MLAQLPEEGSEKTTRNDTEETSNKQVSQHFIGRNNTATTEVAHTRGKKKESQTNPHVQSWN